MPAPVVLLSVAWVAEGQDMGEEDVMVEHRDRTDTGRPHCQVLVVGAGPVGLAAACELRRRGVDLRCVDIALQHTQTTKALGVQARTLELFRRLGVVDRAVARGLPETKFNILSEGRPIAQFDLSGLDTPYPYLLMLPQNETEEILENRLHELGGAVERGVQLQGFTAEEGGVDVWLTHPDGRQEHSRTDWLVACDGAHSFVRSELGLPFEGGTFREEFATANVRMDRLRLALDEFPSVETYLVVPPDGEAEDNGWPASTLLDIGGHLRRAYGVDGEAMLLIRPDGYLGLRSDKWSDAQIRAHLLRWYHPGAVQAAQGERA
jgi:2-polyprenyl-6-methoxyphenol hydroxylase-like FAD-dependent oxidoreductase